jgi:hypothetical protein
VVVAHALDLLLQHGSCACKPSAELCSVRGALTGCVLSISATAAAAVAAQITTSSLPLHVFDFTPLSLTIGWLVNTAQQPKHQMLNSATVLVLICLQMYELFGKYGAIRQIRM